MERLMVQCPIYHKDPATKDYNDKVITKLLKNYRSHPVLLEVPNELFYDKKLIVSETISNILIISIRNKIIFCLKKKKVR